MSQCKIQTHRGNCSVPRFCHVPAISGDLPKYQCILQVMKTRMCSHAALRLNHLSSCHRGLDKEIPCTKQKAMGLYIGYSRGNLTRLGFIASLSPVMMLGLWAALVYRAPAPQPDPIWLWGRRRYWPDRVGISPNRLNLCLHLGLHTHNTYNDNIHLPAVGTHSVCIDTQRHTHTHSCE